MNRESSDIEASGEEAISEEGNTCSSINNGEELVGNVIKASFQNILEILNASTRPLMDHSTVSHLVSVGKMCILFLQTPEEEVPLTATSINQHASTTSSQCLVRHLFTHPTITYYFHVIHQENIHEVALDLLFSLHGLILESSEQPNDSMLQLINAESGFAVVKAMSCHIESHAIQYSGARMLHEFIVSMNHHGEETLQESQAVARFFAAAKDVCDMSATVHAHDRGVAQWMAAVLRLL